MPYGVSCNGRIRVRVEVWCWCFERGKLGGERQMEALGCWPSGCAVNHCCRCLPSTWPPAPTLAVSRAGDYVMTPPGAAPADGAPAVQAFENVRCTSCMHAVEGCWEGLSGLLACGAPGLRRSWLGGQQGRLRQPVSLASRYGSILG